MREGKSVDPYDWRMKWVGRKKAKKYTGAQQGPYKQRSLESTELGPSFATYQLQHLT